MLKRPIQRLIFSQKPLFGFIHINGYFSIYPAHQWINLASTKSILRHADRDADCFGPPYPLYFEIEHSGEDGIEWYKDAFGKLECYERLACLLISGLESSAHVSTSEHWVSSVSITGEKFEVACRLASFGLSIDGEPSLSRFIEEGGVPATPLILRETIDYYDALHTTDFLDFPDILKDAMEKYEAIPLIKKKDFDRAAFLFHQGEFLLRGNFAPFTSYASAVECLLPKHSERCSCCGQEQHRVSKKFDDFVAKYAPVSEGNRASQKKMYPSRSKETHGINIPHIDKEGMPRSFDGNKYLFPWIVRKALVNWLVDPNREQ